MVTDRKTVSPDLANAEPRVRVHICIYVHLHVCDTKSGGGLWGKERHWAGGRHRELWWTQARAKCTDTRMRKCHQETHYFMHLLKIILET